MLAASCVGLAVFGLQTYMYQQGRHYIEVQQTVLSDLQDKELTAYLDMNRLLTTLSTTMLGAIGFLMNSRESASSSLALKLAFGSALCVGVSIYCSYEAHEDILWMLEGQFFDLNNPQMLWSRITAFYAFLLGGMLFLLFVAATLTGVRSHDPKA